MKAVERQPVQSSSPWARRKTWGKTWHTWPDPAAAWPAGEPLLMWSATRDGMISAARLVARDRRLGTSTPAIRRRRSAMG